MGVAGRPRSIESAVIAQSCVRSASLLSVIECSPLILSRKIRPDKLEEGVETIVKAVPGNFDSETMNMHNVICYEAVIIVFIYSFRMLNISSNQGPMSALCAHATFISIKLPDDCCPV